MTMSQDATQSIRASYDALADEYAAPKQWQDRMFETIKFVPRFSDLSRDALRDGQKNWGSNYLQYRANNSRVDSR